MATELTAADFHAQVIESDVPVLVDFWGEHCTPCKNLMPAIDQIAAELNGRAKVVKIDVGANRDLTSGFGVRSIPNLLFFKNGEVRDQFIGQHITKDQIRAKLEALM